MKKLIEIIKVFVFILICQLAGLIGSIFTTPAIPKWYANLRKPFFAPPDWVFAPVWITLFTLMGISAYLVYKQGFEKKKVKSSLLIFGIQLLLNIIWSVLFFGLKAPFFAFFEIIMLWLVILFNIVGFYTVSKRAALLLIPYILWVSFAALLNISIAILN